MTKVSYSELEDRLDAGYYSGPELEIQRELENSGVDIEAMASLLDIVTDGAHKTPTYVDDGVTFLSSGNIFEFRIDLEDTKNISREAHEELERTQVEPGDILVSKSGRIGMAAVAPEDIGECNLYEGVALLRPIDEINPYYLAAFLNSKYGRSQIQRAIKGVSQPHLHLEEIEEIQVPVLRNQIQNEIQELLFEAHQCWRSADELLSKSEEELEAELDLDYEDKRYGSYITPFSKLSGDVRLDPEFYQPIYQNMLDDIRGSGHDLPTFEENNQFVLSNDTVDPSENPAKRYRYVTISHVDGSTGRIVDHDEVTGHDAPNRAKMRLKAGDVLVPYLSASCESVAIVPDSYDGAVGTSGFYVIRSTGANPHYLFALMRSPVIQRQIEQWTSGVRMRSINKTDFQKLRVPVVPREGQKDVATHVSESFNNRRKYGKLIEEAKNQIVKYVAG